MAQCEWRYCKIWNNEAASSPVNWGIIYFLFFLSSKFFLASLNLWITDILYCWQNVCCVKLLLSYLLSVLHLFFVGGVIVSSRHTQPHSRQTGSYHSRVDRVRCYSLAVVVFFIIYSSKMSAKRNSVKIKTEDVAADYKPKNNLSSRKSLRIGTLVWSKLNKWPWWPGM